MAGAVYPTSNEPNRYHGRLMLGSWLVGWKLHPPTRSYVYQSVGFSSSLSNPCPIHVIVYHFFNLESITDADGKGSNQSIIYTLHIWIQPKMKPQHTNTNTNTTINHHSCWRLIVNFRLPNSQFMSPLLWHLYFTSTSIFCMICFPIYLLFVWEIKNKP